MTAGTPVLVSNRTPWGSNNKGGVEILPLNEDKWAKTIMKWSKFNHKLLIKKRKDALKYISNYNINNIALKQNKELFDLVLNNDSNRKTILCFVEYYLPGNKGGGPVRSIANLVETFGDKFDIKIICANHDDSDTKPYKNIKSNNWNTVGKAKVFYASPETTNFKGIKKLLNEASYDLLYLNSFFSFKFTIIPLLLRKLGLVIKKPCIIAPRGEFSPEAVKLKGLKKKTFITLSNWLNLYKNLYWQASSSFEKKDVRRELGNKVQQISIASNLISPIFYDKKKFFPLRKPGPLRLVFLGRISPIKNLDFLLRVLSKINTPVELAIYGPKGDTSYWKRCLILKKKLPSNIKVLVGDVVPGKKVLKVFGQYDLFVFPTLGENFGHAIAESLTAGTPVLVSNQTPWGAAWGSANKDGVEILPLNEDKWAKTIMKWSKFEDKLHIKKRKDALKYISNYNINNAALLQNKELFNSFLNKT